MASKTSDTWVLILAGGDGRRLAAVTTQGDCRPKQYCSLDGGPSLLQLALQRALRLVSPEHIAVVVTAHHRQWWESELASLPLTVIAQPSNRGTALGVLLSLLVIARADWNANIICLLSDHYVEREEVLVESLRHALRWDGSAYDKLTLLGIAPDNPDPDYGYLKPAPGPATAIRAVESFVEKPSRENAALLIQAGNVWNSGLVVGRVQSFLNLYAQQVPDLLENLNLLVKRWPDTRAPSKELVSFYDDHPTCDFSREILQRHPTRLQCLAVPASGWNDIGTPERLAATLSSLSAQPDRRPTTPCHTFTLAAPLGTPGVAIPDERQSWPPPT